MQVVAILFRNFRLPHSQLAKLQSSIECEDVFEAEAHDPKLQSRDGAAHRRRRFEAAEPRWGRTRVGGRRRRWGLWRSRVHRSTR
jgi:hypothetical protein